MPVIKKFFKLARKLDFSKPRAVAPLVQTRENDSILLSKVALDYLLSSERFGSVIDIGSGSGKHADVLEKNGKDVTRFDFGKSRAFSDSSDKAIIGDFLDYEFVKKYDLVWASHVLEHTIHTHQFLEKMVDICVPGEGLIAITVPPAKPEFVGGHVSLWTPALLIYRLVLAGLDCSSAVTLCYGYNISVVVKNKSNDLDLKNLAWDLHDVERISRWLPKDLRNGVDGARYGTVYRGTENFFV
jgi:SAM-dependent methyltransferase